MSIVEQPAEVALRVPTPNRRENKRLQHLVSKDYLSLSREVLDFSSIPTPEFAEARRAVAHSSTITPLHADAKAVATWYLRRYGCQQISYEVTYPQDSRRADVASPDVGVYAEVGQVDDITRIYEVLGLSVVLDGSRISSVLQRFPIPENLESRTEAVVCVPYPTVDDESRAWELDEIEVCIYTRGGHDLFPDRNNRFWG